MQKIVREGEIRIGVLGAFRGKAFMKTAKNSGMKLVAICDNFKHRLDEVCNETGVKGYEDFDEFIKQDFEAVVIASPFNKHAPFAKKALLNGKHVLSETSCNVTLKEGVELYRLAKETDLCYMLAENYCYTRFVMEMKKLHDEDEIGKIRYAEGEYNHPMSINESLRYSPGVKHWRNQLPPTYYITHALAPLMYVTNTIPLEVSCTLIPAIEKHSRPGYVALIRMDNGAVFRIYAGVAGHSCAYSFHGTHGAMESTHGHGYFGPETVRVWHEPWQVGEGQCEDKIYLPNWPSHAKEAEETGHGGGDFFVEYTFANAIRSGVHPYLDAYRGITMSNVGIIAWRSAHQNGKFLPIPDLNNPTVQEEMLKDNLCPFDGVEDSVLYPSDMRWQREFTPEVCDIARIEWRKIGYTDVEIEQLLNK